MANMTITSLQQYWVDRFRVNLNTQYMTDVISSLKVELTTSIGEYVPPVFIPIKEANEPVWGQLQDDAATYFDLVLGRGQQLKAGTYHITITEPKSIYCEEKIIFDDDITINHMEDVRLDISSVEYIAIDTIRISMAPLVLSDNEESSEEIYQTAGACKCMTLNIFNDIGLTYSNCFQTLKEAIASKNDDEPIKELILSLRKGEILPKGKYTFRFVTSYKNRVGALYTKDNINLPYMTKTPPEIESVKMYVNGTGDDVLGVTFKVAPELGVFQNAKFIVKDSDGKDVSKVFKKEVELQGDSRADINYITRTDIPFMKSSYTLSKGKYTLVWDWEDDFLQDQEISFEVGWLLHSAYATSLSDAKDVVFSFKTPLVKPFVSTAKFAIELNGVDVDTLKENERNEIYSAFGTIQEATTALDDPYLKDDDPINELRIQIKNKKALRRGVYSFLMYTENGSGDREYKYMGQIDIAQELTPEIKEVKQKSIDEILVTLEKPCPIEAIELAQIHLIDSYSNTDLSGSLDTIADSNIWEPEVTAVSEFIIRVAVDGNIAQGQYTFYLSFIGMDLRKYLVPIEYMEKRKGHISKIEQVDLEHMKISFSETQSREFLLQTKLQVTRKSDGADFTERFVSLDTALKEYGYAVDDVIIRMDWEDSFPRGRYDVKFVQRASLTQLDIVYAAEVNLDHMTNNKPTIGTITSDNVVDRRNVRGIQLMFSGYIEKGLYEKAVVAIENSKGDDVTNKFLPKDKWTVNQAEKQEIIFAKNILISLFDADTKLTRDTYTVKFHWTDELSYIDDVTASVMIDYIVPYATKAEMISPTRAYFEFPTTMQTSWLETLQFEIYNKKGKLKTDIFKSVADSNNLTSGMSSDNINLDLRDDIDPIDDVEEGAYSVIFYHIVNTVKEADFVASIDIKGTVYPLFAGGSRRCTQEGINLFTFRLRSPISVDILQSYKMEVHNSKEEDITDWFQSITKSNPWEEDDIDPSKGGAIRQVSQFDLKLKGRSLTKLDETLKINNDTLRFGMVTSTGFLMDECWFDVEYAEGVMYELDAENGFVQTSLKEIHLQFQEEQSKAEFKHLSLKLEQITDGEPIDRSSVFGDLDDAIHECVPNEVEYFESLTLRLLKGKTLPSNILTVNNEKRNIGYNLTLTYQTHERSSVGQRVYLQAPMTTEYPAIADVAATENEKGQKGVIITFNPMLARELFDMATLRFTKASNNDYDVFQKDLFYERRQWEINIQSHNEIEYVSSITMPFNSEKTLDRDEYVIELNWLTPSFMSILNMRRIFRLDYILKPVQKIEVVGIGTLKITFKSPLLQSYLLNCQIKVEYVYTDENEDGIVRKTIDMSDYFEPLTSSNELAFPVDEESNEVITDPDPLWSSIHLKLKPNTSLMCGNYTFYIGHLGTEDEAASDELRMVYSGSKHLDVLQNLPTTINSIKQGGLDFVYVNLNDFRDVNMVSSFSVVVKGLTDGVNYSAYFEGIKSSNEYEYKDPETGATIIDYFLDKQERGITVGGNNINKLDATIEKEVEKNTVEIIEGVHTLINAVNIFRLKLGEDRAIPAGEYTFIFKIDDIEYGRCDTELTFMTTTPPEINAIKIVNNSLTVEWLPNAEATSLDTSNFILMTNRGFNDNGDPIGDDKTKCFSPLSGSVRSISPQGSINYVPSLTVPVMPGVSMPAGLYSVLWRWDKSSFMKDLMFTGALDVISQGVKSVILTDADTLHVTLEVKKLGSYLKSLKLQVCNSYSEDMTDLFKDMRESNEEMQDKDEVSEFDIKVEDGEDVVTGTYTFSLMSEITDDEGNTIPTPDYVFSSNIIFMTTDFGELEKVDNLSADDFTLVELKNDKTFLKNYLGKSVERIDVDGREVLTEENAERFCGKTKEGNPATKVYSEPRLDELTFVFDDDVYPCLLNACTLKIINSAGISVVEKFMPISECNNFSPRKVLDKIEFTINGAAYSPDVLESWKVEGNFITGDKIDGASVSGDSEKEDTSSANRTPTFQTIEKSNDFPDDDNDEFTTNKFIVDVDDGDIEGYEIEFLDMVVKDASGMPITDPPIKYTKIPTEVKTVRKMKLRLKEGETLLPDDYTISMTYTNEPGLEGSQEIEAYSISTKLPFLSTDIGKIDSMTVSGLYEIIASFSANLPCDFFQSVNLSVIDSDGIDHADVFKKISDSMNFASCTFINELDNPNQIILELMEGKSLDAGNYTFEFNINLKSGEDDDSKDAPIVYTLWKYTMMLPYMVRSVPVVIETVEQVAIDAVRVKLQKAVNVNLMRNFQFALLNENTGELYEEYFQDLNYTNNFGASIMLTERQYLMYQEGANGWNRVDTTLNKQFNDICFCEDTNEYILAAGTSLYMTRDIRSSKSFTECVKGKVTWNSLLYVNKKVYAFGNDGSLVTYTKSIGWSTPVKIADKSISAAYSHHDSITGVTTLVAVGYKGLILCSEDGVTWTSVEVGYTQNFTDISYYDTYNDGKEDVTPTQKGWYITGSSGAIYYSPDAVTWTVVQNVYAGGALYGITVKDKMIVTCGDIGTVIISEDGITWNKINVAVTTSLKSVEFCDTQFVISGSNGKYLTSKTGKVWTVNNNIQGYNFRAVKTIPSQYKDPSLADSFYAKLNPSTQIGSVSIYSGKDNPNESETMGKLWLNDEMRKRHIGDLYYMTEIEDGIEVRKSRWQYRITEDGEFIWEKAEISSVIQSTGSYTAYILREFADDIDLSKIDDDKKVGDLEIVAERSAVRLAYLTSNPGCIHVPNKEHLEWETNPPVTIMSPDIDIDGQIFDVPYLQIQFDMADELAMHFASYTILDGSGNDITSYFARLHDGVMIYGNSTYIQYVILPVLDDHLKDIVYDQNIQVKWSWCRFDKDTFDISSGNSFRKPIPAITISRVEDAPDALTVEFDEELPRNFLADKEDITKLMIDPHFYRIKEGSIYTTDNDYIDQFEPIDTLNSDSSGKPNGFTLKLSEGGTVPTGDYILIIKSRSTEKDATLDRAESFLYTSAKFKSDIALQNGFPDISSVSLEMYENMVERIVDDGNERRIYEGVGEPTCESDLTLQWFAEGTDSCKSHVGDIWKDKNNSDKKYTWVYDPSIGGGSFYWEPIEAHAHLRVVFNPYPSKAAILKEIESIELLDRTTRIINGNKITDDIDLSSFLSQDVGEWDLSYIGQDKDNVAIAYIPIDETKSFPGTENGRFTLNWKSESSYPQITYPEGWPDGTNQLVLEERGIEYGVIKKVEDYTILPEIRIDEYGKEIEIPGEAGLIISLTHALSTDWLCNLEIMLTHKALNAEDEVIEEDIAGSFKSIRESNYDWYDEDNLIKKTDTIRLTLLDGMDIESGSYDLDMYGERDRNDIETDIEKDGLVHYNTKNIQLRYVTTSPPKDMRVTVGTVAKFAVPTMTVEFLDELPELSDITGYRLKVVKVEDGQDYTDCFCKNNEKSMASNRGYDYEVEEGTGMHPKIRKVFIPMKDARVLLSGNYEVVFYFSESSSLTYVNIFGKVRKFTITGEAVITPLGKVVQVTTPTREECNIKVEFDASINTLSALTNSQIGKALKITSYDALWKKLDLSFKHRSKSNENAQMFTGFKGSADGGKTYKTRIRSNCKINPGFMRVKFTLGGSDVFREGICEFKGCILNKVGKATKDKTCYIVKEMRGGKVSRKVYKSYSKAYKRIKKLEKLNNATTAHYKMCKKCRKIKLLTTSKIKAQLEKLLIKDGNPSNAIYQAAESYYFDIMAPKLGCTKVQLSQEESSTDGYNHIMCDNYASKNLQYTWVFKIATMGSPWPGKGNKNNKRIYFYYIIKNGVQLDRGWRANRKGKKTKNCKAYGKKLAKYIKNYKKKVSRCKKCKKRVLAKKSSSSIGWSSALFPDALRQNKKAQNKIAKYLNKYYKNKPKKKKVAGKKKKQKNPLYCKTHKFKLVKKNNTYCRLTCSNVATTDKTLEYGCYKATFKK